jgi:GMP synthase (glutamine-hydrolysing)
MKFYPAKSFDTEDEFDDFLLRTDCELKRIARYGKEAVGLISGGADSTSSGILAHNVLGPRFHGVHIETAFMRKGECKDVLWYLNSACKLPVVYKDLSDEFLPRVIDAGKDSEKKREAFSEAYFEVARKLANEFEAEIIVQGTIKADVIESEGGIKRQQNVLTEKWLKRYDAEGIIVAEPLLNLYKPQSRHILRHYGIPEDITGREPFPGPGLSVRIVGQVTPEKLEILKEADAIATPVLKHYTKEFVKKDSQCICAIMDNKTKDVDVDPKYFGDMKNSRVTEDKVTGMVENKRTYTNMLLIDSPTDVSYLSLASERFIKENLDKGIGRVAVLVEELNADGKYNIFLRPILTEKFETAQVPPIARPDIKKISYALRSNLPDKYRFDVAGVYYDITPKPPATIEFE